jgi:serine/threonine-protein kinase
MDYIAPEQIRDATSATAASDLYALGCSLYYAVAGTPPYPGGDAKQKVRWHERTEAPPVRSLNPAVPVELAEIIERLMEKDPADRPASAAEVARQLREIAGDEPAAATDSEADLEIPSEDEDDWLPVRPNRMVWALIAFFGVILSGMIGLLTVILVRRGT